MIVAQVSQALPSRAPQFRLHFPTREIRTHQEWVTTRAAACLRCCTFSFVLDIDKRHRIPTGWSFKTSFRVKEAVYSQTSLTILEPVKLEDLNKPVEQPPPSCNAWEITVHKGTLADTDRLCSEPHTSILDIHGWLLETNGLDRFDREESPPARGMHRHPFARTMPPSAL